MLHHVHGHCFTCSLPHGEMGHSGVVLGALLSYFVSHTNYKRNLMQYKLKVFAHKILIFACCQHKFANLFAFVFNFEVFPGVHVP